MDYETVSPEDFGASLQGLGLNLLVTDVARTSRFLREILHIEVFRESADFAIAVYDGGPKSAMGKQVFQLHCYSTYHSHPALGLLPDNPPRGAGVDIRLYNSDPDKVEARALTLEEELGLTVLQTASNKPHGTREVAILDPDGYLWSCSLPKS